MQIDVRQNAAIITVEMSVCGNDVPSFQTTVLMVPLVDDNISRIIPTQLCGYVGKHAPSTQIFPSCKEKLPLDAPSNMR